MKVALGPVVTFRGVYEEIAKYNVLYVIEDGGDTQPILTVGGQEIEGVVLLDRQVHTIYSFKVEVPLSDAPQIVEYGLRGQPQGSKIAVPAKSEMPKVAFCSCNGFSSAKEITKVQHKNNMWKNADRANFGHKGILDAHTETPFHLLIMGGDQVYADSIWDEIKEFRSWKDLSFVQRVEYSVTEGLKQQIDDFYFNLYLGRWTQPELKVAMASIPSVMMWDDHDIFDGWGSHPEKLQKCALFQETYKIAKKYFGIFQQQVQPGVRPGNSLSDLDFSFVTRFNGLEILGLDQRSNRTMSQVLHSDTYSKLRQHINMLDEGDTSHLFVLSSIPIAHPDMSWIDTAAAFVLPETHEDKFELMDDLRDHWNSVEHKGERLRLIHNLFRFSAEKKIRVTILSGDVHVAALGVIKNERVASGTNSDRINQLTSSGIVHPGPPKMMAYVYEMLSARPQEFDREIIAQMLPIPGAKSKFILQRNWLSIVPGNEQKYWVNFHVEGLKTVFEKAIHAVSGAPE